MYCVKKREGNFVNISYARIQHFLVTVKYMNMNKAAKELFVSQPALSLSISKLEEELGVTLFYRDRSKLILSREAELLLPRFEQIRQDYDSLVQATKMLKRPLDNYINISFTGSAYVFSALYAKGLIEEFDGGILKLSYVDLDQAKNMLLTGQTEFAITYPPISHPMVTTDVVYEEPIGVILPSAHPLARKERLEFADLKSLNFHGLSKHHIFRRLVDNILADYGVFPRYVSENSQAEYGAKMVENEGRYCFFSTPQNFQYNFSVVGDYVYRPVNDMVLNRKIGISYLTSSKTQYKYASLLNMLKGTISELYLNNNLAGHRELIEMKRGYGQ